MIILDIFTQNVNVARFARNVEWDFFCGFQTPWMYILCCITILDLIFRMCKSNCDKTGKHQINAIIAIHSQIKRKENHSDLVIFLLFQERHEFSSPCQSKYFWDWQDRFSSDYFYGLDRICVYLVSICYVDCTTCTLWKICRNLTQILEL